MSGDYDRAIQRVQGVLEAATDARRVVAGLPNAPQRYWQGLGIESPLADAWYRINRAMDELRQALEKLDEAEDHYLRTQKGETCRRSS